MKQQFVKVKIDTDKGLVEGYIDICKITAFRENVYDCNRTIVFTDNDCFVVYIPLKEFCKIVGII